MRIRPQHARVAPSITSKPSQKRHELNAKGVAIALDKLRVEAQKCVLLCSHCHAEVEDGTVIYSGPCALDRTDTCPG